MGFDAPYKTLSNILLIFIQSSPAQPIIFLSGTSKDTLLMHEMYHLQDTFLAPFQAHLLIKKNNRKHDLEGTAYNPMVSPWVL
jgi:hypothetical protein